MPSLRKSNSGFTLIEVLVAMAVLAVVATTIYKQMSLNSHQLSRMESISFGRMIALNTLAEIRLGLTEPDTPITAQEFANQRWQVDIEKLEAQDNQDISGYLIKTYRPAEEEASSGQIIGYVSP